MSSSKEEQPKATSQIVNRITIAPQDDDIEMRRNEEINNLPESEKDEIAEINRKYDEELVSLKE